MRDQRYWEGTIRCHCEGEWRGDATAPTISGLLDSLQAMAWEHHDVVHPDRGEFRGRVNGHTLPNEGRVRDRHGFWGGTAATNCSCGELSPILPSDYARKKWHRTHKAEVVSARLAALLEEAGRG